MNVRQTSSFGDLLKLFRQRKKLSQQLLANKIEVHRNSISLWERDMERPETFSTLIHLATVLDLDEEEKRVLIEARFGTISFLSFSNIPFNRNPYFTGREHFLDDLHQQLISGTYMAITQAIVGLGGIGKTQLAVEYAYRYQDSYHTIFWISADTLEAIIHAFVEAARYLWLPERNDNDEQRIVVAVKRWLSSHKRWLLIFDNLEDLGLIKQFVPSGTHGSILMTTRRHVTEPVAQAFPLTPLSEEEGALFLLKRCKRHSTQNSPIFSAEYHQAITISNALDGLPLALDQAGAYILETGSSLIDYLLLYEHEQAFLLAQRGSVPTEHPESVTSTFALTFDRIRLINPMAFEILTACAFLAADEILEELFTLGASQLGSSFEYMITNPLLFYASLKDLLAYSLISRNAERKTFSMHRLVQAVLRNSIQETEQHAWVDHIVKAIHQSFPNVEDLTQWPQCDRYLSHIEICHASIIQWDIVSVEAAQLLYQAGSYAMERAKYAQAKMLLKTSLTIYERVLGLDHFILTQNLNLLGWLCYLQGEYNNAEPLYQQALMLREKHLGRNHYSVAEILNNLGLIFHARGQDDEAKLLLQRALTIREQQFGLNHCEVARSLNNLALIYREQECYSEAEALLLRALTIREQQLDSGHTNIANSLNNLAKLYLYQGRQNEAEPLLLRALDILQQHLGSDHPLLAFCFQNLALLHHEQHHYDQAEQLYKQALTIRESVLDSNHPDIVLILERLSLLYNQQGRFTEAKSLLLRIRSIQAQSLESEHLNLIEHKQLEEV